MHTAFITESVAEMSPSSENNNNTLRVTVFICGPKGFVHDAAVAANKKKKNWSIGHAVELEVHHDGYYF